MKKIITKLKSKEGAPTSTPAPFLQNAFHILQKVQANGTLILDSSAAPRARWHYP